MSWLTDRFEGENILDIGHNHKVKFFTHTNSGDVLTGAFILHPKGPKDTGAYPGEDWCLGSVGFDIPENTSDTGAKWELRNLNPLHIEPSVLCDCGDHGWIRNGKWEPS